MRSTRSALALASNEPGGPSSARALTRAPRFRCPRFNARAAPAARSMSALALGLLLALAATARGEERSIALAVAEHGFAPPEIEAAAGERLRLEVTNQTAVAIEFESFELNRERVVPPGRTVAVYVSGLSPGRYEFFDDSHQERRGALVVK